MEGCGAAVDAGAVGNRRVRAAAGTRRRSQKPYKGIRMRKWGKWVAEIREPNKRSRIWLGSYSTAEAAARAYDTAVYYLRGPTAKLNFPDEISVAGPKDLSAAAIRAKAAEVGARVDALHTNSFSPAGEFEEEKHANKSLKPSWFQEIVDLNKKPEPEDSDVNYW
ncbi:ethylene-responsive transcription factor ERF011-like [Olea europaea var. sylvestris]|uniref:Ethylene-responsive transcription factor ERF011-like n=1 Tax=Olea europaea subsp. europaea TaxID=158383 RepID=A0A8S0QAN8_OLEEU|nr:ethylene-responsive transcription factor ERF011-like [Olea europaea var. sylvestris]CAA2964807.1 ethylene-responsive transcription factor ERF011-like [Olea europaea subsp. europaea]